MTSLMVRTIDGENINFKGKDAKTVYDEIYKAGARGASWTLPIKLANGWTVTFVLDNITSFSYK